MQFQTTDATINLVTLFVKNIQILVKALDES